VVLFIVPIFSISPSTKTRTGKRVSHQEKEPPPEDSRLKVPQFAQKREQLGAWADLMKNSFEFPTSVN